MRPLIAISLCALMACKGKDEAPPAAKSAEPAMVPETTEMPAPGTTASGINLSGLGDQLKKEAASRPHSGITVEQAFEALDKAGIATSPRKQLLGMAINARYCANTHLQHGLAVVVCEYTDDKTAESSTKIVEQRFGAATSNVIRKVRGSTMIAVMGVDRKTNGSDVDKILATFSTL